VTGVGLERAPVACIDGSTHLNENEVGVWRVAFLRIMLIGIVLGMGMRRVDSGEHDE
jgi:hypothetical protein